jgi:Spy/CpxP family protein refolding chaperone
MIARSIFCALLLITATAEAAQQPYAGEQAREVKALSGEEISQYLSGAGMGYAKAAELNGYPGPMHVLELSDQLALTPVQRDRVAALMKTHKAEARALGLKVVEAERSLDALFRGGTTTDASLAARVHAAAAARGNYRLAHLETHRRLRAMLTPEQVARYSALRGYSAAADGSAHGAASGSAHRH